MGQIEFQDGAIQIAAAIIGDGLNLETSTLLALMREREITAMCERGEDDDAGRYRLTFFHKSRRLRLVVDGLGRVLQRSMIDFGDLPLPASMHKTNC